MSKRIILLALAAVSAAALVLPAMAMALTEEEEKAVHVVPAPTGTKTIDGEGTPTLTGNFGSVVCKGSSGKATFENSTTGTFEQTFTGCTLGTSKCTTEGQAEEVITTTELPFHLLTVEDTTTHAFGPGILVTPNPTTGVFAHFVCGFLKFTVEGNGLVGTITNPKCSETSDQATIEFSSSSTGVQTHKTVVGTTTEYSLTNQGLAVSEDAAGVITLGTPAKLECT